MAGIRNDLLGLRGKCLFSEDGDSLLNKDLKSLPARPLATRYIVFRTASRSLTWANYCCFRQDPEADHIHNRPRAVPRF